jgi:predicted RNA-binding protein YlxR (DUF448 family)
MVQTPSQQEPSERRPVRTCAGCQKREEKGAGASPRPRAGLVRVVLGSAGAGGDGGKGARGVVADVGGSGFGRGAYVHADPSCLKKACSGGFARAFRTGVHADARELGEQITAGCDRRIEGLIVAARRARKIAIGEEAGPKLAAGAPLAVVACDAGANAARTFAPAIEAGRAVAWKNKATLGALIGRDEVAAIVVDDRGIAEEIVRARATGNAVSQDVAKENVK